jgi:hypothetical protein
MKKVTAKIPKQVDAALDQQACASEGWANKLRLWFAIVFGVAAAWSLSSGSPVRYIYLTLAVLWLIATLVIKAKLKGEFPASLVTMTTNLDLTIINLGLLLCWWTGLFAERAPEIFFCYFPVLATAAMRYRISLVIKAGIYAALFYTLVATIAMGFPFVPLTMLLAMVVVTALVSWKPKSLLVKAVTDAAQEAYALGVKERETELAEQIQDGILAREIAQVPGLWVVAKHEAGLETGGDYYYVFETGRGPLVAVGDLGGQGIEATLAIAQLHHQLSEIIRRETSLTGILEELNAALWQRYRGARQFTCMLARWEDEELHYVNAGHLPAIRLSKQQRSQLPVTSGPVGASEQAAFTEATLNFPARDLLLVYTDGLYSEATQDTKQGVAEVERMIDQFSHGEVNTVCYRVFDCCKPHREIPKDDRTLVVIRRQPSAFEKTGQEASAGAAA